MLRTARGFNASLNLTAYEYTTGSPVRRIVPIDAHIVPCYPKIALLKGSLMPAKGSVQVFRQARLAAARMRDRTPYLRVKRV